MRRHLGLMLAIATVLGAADASAAEIRIGFATPLTGPFATTGARHRTAVELAVKDLNQNGGVLAHPVRLVSADDACGVGEAEAAAQQLVDAGVLFVVGHLCSHSSLMAAPVYEAAGVPMMTTTASHPRLTEEGRGNVFRLIGRDDVQGRLAGDLLAERWPRGRIAILHDGSTYGAGLAAEVRQRLHEHRMGETSIPLPARGSRTTRPLSSSCSGPPSTWSTSAATGLMRHGSYARRGSMATTSSWWVGTR